MTRIQLDPLARAVEIATNVHHGQVDKGGEPYILHCLAVMQQSRRDAIVYCNASDTHYDFVKVVSIAAVLHDTFEDLQAGPDVRADFRDQVLTEFGISVFEAVDALSRRNGEGHEAYVARVRANPHARFIKPRDIRHNLRMERLLGQELGLHDLQRVNEYLWALGRLES